MKALNLFAGAGGGHLVAPLVGAESIGSVEWLSWRADRIRQRFPREARMHGDVKTFRGDAFGIPDLVWGGSPCQDFSASGQRAGLAGDRSAHALDQIRVVQESGCRWHLWENVAGALTTPKHDPGADFRALLAALTGIGHQHTWCVLTANLVGAPHPRPRVFVLSWRSPLPTLPVPGPGAPPLECAAWAADVVRLRALAQPPWPGFGRWPTRNGEVQASWEPPRLEPKDPDRQLWKERISALGDGWVPTQVAAAWFLLLRQAQLGIPEARYVAQRAGDWPTLVKHEPRLGYQDRTSGKLGTQKSLTTEVFDAAGLRPRRGDLRGPGLSARWCEALMGWPDGYTDPTCQLVLG